MTGCIGYYVHHHGAGHRQRAMAIAAEYRGSITLIGTGLGRVSGDLPALDLPDDRLPHGNFSGADGEDATPPALHYAPLHHAGIRQRTALITGWIAQAQPRLMVVDVSVEVAMLARLAGVPVVYVRLSGRRDDPPHGHAFASALGLLAPYAEALDHPQTPDWVRAKTFYAPGITPLLPAAAPKSVGESDLVLVVNGKGGAATDGAKWAEAAASVPERQWRVIGPATIPAAVPPNLEMLGWIDDPDALIASAGVVIGAAGDGVVSAVLAHARPFICLPEARPFGEQVAKAERLAANHAAIVPAAWPAPHHWRGLIDAATAQTGKRGRALTASDGAARAARWLEQLAAGYPEIKDMAS